MSPYVAKCLRAVHVLTTFCALVAFVGLLSVATLLYITDLKLGSCSGITDVGLLAVIQLPRLVSLDIDDCDGITDAVRVSVATKYPNKTPGGLAPPNDGVTPPKATAEANTSR